MRGGKHHAGESAGPEGLGGLRARIPIADGVHQALGEPEQEAGAVIDAGGAVQIGVRRAIADDRRPRRRLERDVVLVLQEVGDTPLGTADAKARPRGGPGVDRLRGNGGQSFDAPGHHTKTDEAVVHETRGWIQQSEEKEQGREVRGEQQPDYEVTDSERRRAVAEDETLTPEREPESHDNDEEGDEIEHGPVRERTQRRGRNAGGVDEADAREAPSGRAAAPAVSKAGNEPAPEHPTGKEELEGHGVPAPGTDPGGLGEEEDEAQDRHRQEAVDGMRTGAREKRRCRQTPGLPGARRPVEISESGLRGHGAGGCEGTRPRPSAGATWRGGGRRRRGLERLGGGIGLGIARSGGSRRRTGRARSGLRAVREDESSPGEAAPPEGCGSSKACGPRPKRSRRAPRPATGLAEDGRAGSAAEEPSDSWTSSSSWS